MEVRQVKKDACQGAKVWMADEEVEVWDEDESGSPAARKRKENGIRTHGVAEVHLGCKL